MLLSVTVNPEEDAKKIMLKKRTVTYDTILNSHHFFDRVHHVQPIDRFDTILTRYGLTYTGPERPYLEVPRLDVPRKAFVHASKAGSHILASVPWSVR